jgi:hypothetical protein
MEQLAKIYSDEVIAVHTSFDTGARHSATRHIRATDYVIDGIDEAAIVRMVAAIDEKYEKNDQEEKKASELGLRRSTRARKQPRGALYQQLLASM